MKFCFLLSVMLIFISLALPQDAYCASQIENDSYRTIGIAENQCDSLISESIVENFSHGSKMYESTVEAEPSEVDGTLVTGEAWPPDVSGLAAISQCQVWTYNNFAGKTHDAGMARRIWYTQRLQYLMT